MVRWFFLYITLHIAILAEGQNGAILQFNKTIHNFNVIKEIDGKANYDFIFINNSNVPIIIKQVKSACGCMSSYWTKGPILPGKKGVVTVTFNPDNRPGNFDKTIIVYNNSITPVIQLRMKGKVIPKNRTILDNYPYEFTSGLRMPYDCIAFRVIKKGKLKMIEIPVLNNSGKDLDINFINLPSCLKIELVPKVLKHMQEGVVYAEFNTKSIDQLGRISKEISYLFNGVKENLLVTANIQQDFSNLSLEDRADAPFISIDKRLIKFGDIAVGTNIEFSINVANVGKSLLKLYRIYGYDTDLEITPALRDLSPGESQVFKIKVKINNITEGKHKIIVGLISNDPVNPEIKVRLSANLN